MFFERLENCEYIKTVKISEKVLNFVKYLALKYKSLETKFLKFIWSKEAKWTLVQIAVNILQKLAFMKMLKLDSHKIQIAKTGPF